jgi:hypothetical protein
LYPSSPSSSLASDSQSALSLPLSLLPLSLDELLAI